MFLERESEVRGKETENESFWLSWAETVREKRKKKKKSMVVDFLQSSETETAIFKEREKEEEKVRFIFENGRVECGSNS